MILKIKIKKINKKKINKTNQYKSYYQVINK